ncbi:MULTISPECIES: AEC family transporter [Stutzerimonas stutzeri subgroup]|uniref:Transporter n=1 Tax=Stutzerimonas stutzeri TaxID=316 RepID=A0A0D7E5B7_STUST|nr:MULTISPECIES: AEC family transporter [Stutzerimonas stutzeri subgroup]KIZ36079.1 transporter [Stutzerimonas stutzeri]OCX96409.1 MAG: transporter [Pseudomonas sp. K35]
MVVVLAILPIFGLITLGYLFGWRQWLNNEGAAGLASVTFKLFMPAVLFTGIARAELSDGMSPMLLLAYFVPVLLVFLLVNLVAHRRAGRATPLGLTAAYSNNVLVGIPLVTTLLGAESLVYVFAVLVFHSLVLFSLQSFYAALGDGDKVSAPALLRNLANPLIIGLVLGALLNLSGLELPEPLWRVAVWLAQAALPCALMVLGISLSRYRLRPNGTALLLTLVKLAAFPALVWWLSGLLPGLNQDARNVLVLLAACPSGVNVLAFVKHSEDTRAVSSTVFLSTVTAVISLPLWMLLAAG